jgi:hypothetical protein
MVLMMYALLIFGVFMIESAARHLPVTPDKLLISLPHGLITNGYAGWEFLFIS